jgi:hypothetical protein
LTPSVEVVRRLLVLTSREIGAAKAEMAKVATATSLEKSMVMKECGGVEFEGVWSALGKTEDLSTGVINALHW